jgi:hypothetical protein
MLSAHPHTAMGAVQQSSRRRLTPVAHVNTETCPQALPLWGSHTCSATFVSSLGHLPFTRPSCHFSHTSHTAQRGHKCRQASWSNMVVKQNTCGQGPLQQSVLNTLPAMCTVMA